MRLLKYYEMDAKDMPDTLRFMFLNLPNPPGRNVLRGFAGGFGTLGSVEDATLMPIYLLYAASAAITSKCDFSILDAQALRYSPSQVVEAVKIRNPNVLVSWVSLPSLNDDIGVLKQIKKTVPNTLVVLLGAICNVMPEEILLQNSGDLIIQGKYPYRKLIFNLIIALNRNPLNQSTFDEIGALYLRENKIVQNARQICNEDLNQLSFDAYYQLPLKRYLRSISDAKGKMISHIPLITGIGCPYSCMYCPYPVGYGHTVLYKSPRCIVDEIEFLKTQFNINGFLFRNQLFTHNKEWVISLCDEIICRKLDVKWYIEARVNEVSDELLKIMKRAGCFRIHYGVETGTPEMLKKVGKPGLEIDTIKKVFMATKHHGIATAACIVVGLPGENEETIKNSVNLLREINPDDAYINVITPYPGTKLFEISKERGWISTYDWSKYTSNNAVMSNGMLSPVQMDTFVKNFSKEFRIFKLLTDMNYRKSFLKRIPRHIFSRMRLYLNS